MSKVTPWVLHTQRWSRLWSQGVYAAVVLETASLDGEPGWRVIEEANSAGRASGPETGAAGRRMADATLTTMRVEGVDWVDPIELKDIDTALIDVWTDIIGAPGDEPPLGPYREMTIRSLGERVLTSSRHSQLLEDKDIARRREAERALGHTLSDTDEPGSWTEITAGIAGIFKQLQTFYEERKAILEALKSANLDESDPLSKRVWNLCFSYSSAKHRLKHVQQDRDANRLALNALVRAIVSDRSDDGEEG